MILRRLFDGLLSRIRSLFGVEGPSAKHAGDRSLAEIFRSLEDLSQALVERHQTESLGEKDLDT